MAVEHIQKRDIGMPFKLWAASFDQRLFLFFGPCFNCSNHQVGHGDCSPLPPQKAFAHGEGHEVIVPFDITSGIEGYGSHALRFGGIGGVIVLKNKHVRPKLNFQRVVIKISDKNHMGLSTSCVSSWFCSYPAG